MQHAAVLRPQEVRLWPRQVASRAPSQKRQHYRCLRHYPQSL